MMRLIDQKMTTIWKASYSLFLGRGCGGGNALSCWAHGEAPRLFGRRIGQGALLWFLIEKARQVRVNRLRIGWFE